MDHKNLDLLLQQRDLSQPKICYMICAVPRSGSTLLCEALTNTGVAGQPKEYFSPKDARATWASVCARLGDDPSTSACQITCFEELVRQHRQNPALMEKCLAACIEQCTAANGVYGVKIMWHHFQYLTHIMKQLPICQGLSIIERVNAIYPHLRYIWIRRRDRVRQAISHAKSLQTLVWHITPDSRPQSASKPIFSFQLIDLIVHRLAVDEGKWEKFFKKQHIEPLVIIYEDFVASYEETALRILEELGLATEQITFGPRRLQRQADELSEEWVERYHALLEHSIWHRCLSSFNRLVVPCVLACLHPPKLRSTITRMYVGLVRLMHGFSERGPL